MSILGGAVKAKFNNLTKEKDIMCKLCPLEARAMAGGNDVNQQPHRVWYNNEELYRHLMFHQKSSLAEMLAVYMFEDNKPS